MLTGCTHLVQNQLLVVNVPGSETLQDCLEAGEAALRILGEVLSQRVEHLLLPLGKPHQLCCHDCLPWHLYTDINTGSVMLVTVEAWQIAQCWAQLTPLSPLLCYAGPPHFTCGNNRVLFAGLDLTLQ